MIDLPDYRREVNIVESITIITEGSATVDIVAVGGVTLATPTVSACVPISIENPAIAYDGVNDRFTIDIEKWSATDTVNVEIQNATIAVTQSGSWTVTISGTVTVTGTVAATQGGTWNIGTLTTITNTVTIAGTVAISGTVTVSGTVAISGTVTVTGTVAATQSGIWNISTLTSITNTVTISGTVTVSGTVTISGDVNVKASGITTIYKSISANNAVNNIHTVTAGKTFYLVSLQLAVTNNGSGNFQTGNVQADTGGDSSFIALLVVSVTTDAVITINSDSVLLTPSVPMPFTAGTVFRVSSYDANVYSYAQLIGWEE